MGKLDTDPPDWGAVRVQIEGEGKTASLEVAGPRPSNRVTHLPRDDALRLADELARRLGLPLVVSPPAAAGRARAADEPVWPPAKRGRRPGRPRDRAELPSKHPPVNRPR